MAVIASSVLFKFIDINKILGELPSAIFLLRNVQSTNLEELKTI